MSEEEKDQNFSYHGDSLNESFGKSLNSGNGGLPPKINPADFSISPTNQVIVNPITSSATSQTSTSDKE